MDSKTGMFLKRPSTISPASFPQFYRVDDTDNAEAVGSSYKAVSSLGIGCGKPPVCQNQCCVFH